MIAFQHSQFSGAEVFFAISGVSDTFSAPASTDSAVGFASSLAKWANDPARAWSAAFTCDPVRLGHQLALKISSDQAFTFVPNAAAIAASGLAGSLLPITTQTGGAAVATLWPSAVSSRQFLPWDKSAGVVSAAGGFLPSIAAAIARRPSFRFVPTIDRWRNRSHCTLMVACHGCTGCRLCTC